jgi:hypothetical protein
MNVKTILTETALMVGYTYVMFASAYTASKLTKVAIQYFS